jgi:exonuclease 3'-5' domain-containing protein 1
MEVAPQTTLVPTSLKQGELYQIRTSSNFPELIKSDVSTKTITITQVEDVSDLTKSLAKSTLREGYELVDTVDAIPDLIENLVNQPTTPPSLYIDLERVNLSRQGSISILQIHIAPLNKSYLVDSHTLHSKAFDTLAS